MLYNYLIVALRNIAKNRIFSFINIFGLAVGLASCLIIFQYVSFELSYNTFHANSENIYRVSYSKEKDGIESFHTVLTYSGIGPLLKEKFPEVEDFTRLRPMRIITATSVVTYQDDIYEENRVYYADQSFLDMFSFQVLEGDGQTALQDPFSAVITASTAKKYFGEADPLGKVLQHGSDHDYVVTAVIGDVPLNSHVKFDFLLSHSTLSAVMPPSWSDNNLTTFHGHLYISMTPGTDMELFKARLPQFVDDFVGGRALKENGTVLKLQVMSLEDIHLHSHIEHEPEVNGDFQSVQYFSIIALIILLIAWINYMNLSTSRAIERAHEVGVRKILGAGRWQLIKQFLIEAGIINVLAIILAVCLVLAAQPFLTHQGATFLAASSIWNDATFWLALILLLIAGIICSGVFPALALSGFKPVDVMKGGSFKTSTGTGLRKILVVFQFAASVALIVGTAVVYLQIQFLKNRELGVNLDRGIAVRAPLLVDSLYGAQVSSFKSELMNQAAIDHVVATADIPGREFNSATWYKKINEPDDKAQFCYRSSADEHLIEALNIEIVSGRNFVPEDPSSATLLNTSAARLFQFSSVEDAVGKQIRILGSDDADRLNIVGVMKDYHHLSPIVNYAPLVLNYSPISSQYYIVKFKAGGDPDVSIQRTLPAIKQSYQRSFGGNPYSYIFLDEEFEKQYLADRQFGYLFGVFAVIGLIIACLGLFGLSSYTVLKKTKEIGVRKVLGSSVAQLLISFWKVYLLLILIANLLSWPLIYVLMQNWLEGFAHRIPLYLWLFPIAGLMVALLAFLTVSYHTIRAAIANPADALSHE